MSKEPIPANVDFASLRTLQVVRELRSISMAAKRLDVDQSTVSHTLKRLRKVFDDPLFVRVNRGIVATQRCDEIAAGLGGLLERFERISVPRSFDPARVGFELVVSLSHTGQVALMAHIVRYLRKNAPEVRVRLIQSRGSSYQALEAGTCDILLRPMPYEPVPYHRSFLLRTKYVSMVDRDSPHASRGMTLEEFAAASHVLISFEGVSKPPWLSVMESKGYSCKVALDLPTTSAIDHFIRGTDLVVTVSEELAWQYADRLAVIETPIQAGQDIYMFWSDNTHRLETMRWVRGLIAAAAREPQDALEQSPQIRMETV